MELASRLLELAAPGLRPPSSVRTVGDEPIIEASTQGTFGADLAAAIRRESAAIGAGNIAVVAPAARVQEVEAALTAEGVDFGRALRGNLDHQVTVTPVSLVKGLELDACIVVEPSDILEQEHRGAQALYVALTRATKRLSILHTRPLPAVLAAGD
jgi:DNA helicase IV